MEARRARLRPAARADRADAGRPPRRVPAARLLAGDAETSHTTCFDDLPDLLSAGTLSVVNDTRVVPARIAIDRPRGEVLLVEQLDDGTWEALARPSRRLRAGRTLRAGRARRGAGGGAVARPARRRAGGARAAAPVHLDAARRRGAVPDRVRARARVGGGADRGSALHGRRCWRELDVERVTLHVGLDTFRPLQAETVEEHPIHGERYRVERGGVGADPARRAGARGRHDDGARPRDGGERRPARRPHGPVHHAGLRVPPRRSPADELPSPALDAARARHGLRGRARSSATSTPRQSTSATASIRSAMRC